MNEVEISANRRTVLAYERAAAVYRSQVSPTPNDEVAALLDHLATLVPAGTVLELGSGPGIDARELERRGLTVRRTDATVGFVDLLHADGYPADVLDALTDDYGGPYDAVLADAVLVHFSPQQCEAVFAKAAAVATVLALTVKEGDGELWTSAKLGIPRWFSFWREGPLRASLGRAGWQVVELRHWVGRSDDWMYVVATRLAPGEA